jgi:hypothetical protein
LCSELIKNKVTIKGMTSFSKKSGLVLAAGVVFGVIVSSFFMQSEVAPQAVLVKSNEEKKEVNDSRVWMEHAQQVVREAPVTPPRSARFYAYVATAYHNTLEQTGSEAEAGVVVRDIINHLVPAKESQTNAQFEEIVGNEEVVLSDKAQTVKDELLARAETDGASNKWDGVRPQGEQYWVGDKPLEPAATTWQRWIIASTTFEVPPPPAWGSEEHAENVALVKAAAMARTNEQAAAVNFWGGVPGTEAPAGIWQNVLFNESEDFDLTDLEYAYTQMILAQSLADSFLECWTTKYTFWTKRPSMDDASIADHLEMDNPLFPSYVSGHSTISRTAAGVLGALLPAKRELWLSNAEEAKNSRLWAGIHFPYDNEQGFALGEKVADEIIKTLALEPLR